MYGPAFSCLYHHHHRCCVVRVDRCAAPWPLAISDLHSVDSGRALASSWTLFSQTLWGRPSGLLQLAIGFLHLYVSTIRCRASCAGTPGSRRATRRVHQRILSICRWHLMWKASSIFMSANKWIHISAPYSSTDITNTWYRCTLVLILRELHFHTICREFITEQASPILRSTSGWP